MLIINPLCQLAGIDPNAFSKKEKILLETYFFTRICEEIKEVFKQQYKDYFYTLKFNPKMENETMETHLARLIINDIVLTGEYSLSGIAHYSYKPEDVIYEVAIGNNTDPSASLLRKIMELHCAVRPLLYQEMMRKVISNYLKMHCKE